MTNAILNFINEKIVTLDSNSRCMIIDIVGKNQSAIDTAMDITSLDIFSVLAVNKISVQITDFIKKESSSLKNTIINRAKKNNIGTDDVTSNQLISMFTDEVFHYSFTQKELHEAQHYIKEVIKNEIIADLDKQIDTFKHFLKRS